MIVEVYKKNKLINRLECIKTINLDTIPRRGDTVIIKGREYIVLDVKFDLDNVKCKLILKW